MTVPSTRTMICESCGALTDSGRTLEGMEAHTELHVRQAGPLVWDSADMDSVVIIGASGHAKVIADIIEREGRYRIDGLIDASYAPGNDTFGYEVLGRDEDLPALVVERSIRRVIVAIGDNFARSKIESRISELCPQLGYIKAIHPAACIARDVTIGDGTAIMAGVTVNPGCSIGRSCILNTNSSLDHDSVMEDFSSLAPGAIVGGGCKIGEFSAICIGATLIHDISVGAHSVIGAGATVFSPVPPRSVVFGTPAKLIKVRDPGDKYL